ncbi:MAG: recombinase RecA [Candidatus Bipolaricaulota bacterium]|jgi:recombination protein RecA|nr:recombinase RecA [Candidatus Bipolaricaulota bacterium]
MGKQEVLDSTLKQIKKAYGEGAIMWLGDGAQVLALETVPSGSLALDIALGVGGVPRGRIVEIFGAESSGKTTLALHMIAEVQKRDGTAAFIDAEHAVDPRYTRALGVDLDHILLSQPNSGEQALEITEQLTRSGAIDIIVIDSVAALVPMAEIEGQMGDSQVGLQARLMSQAMRKLSGAISQSKTIVVFTNQIRSVITGTRFGPATTTSGGRALKFYATLRLNLWNSGKIEEGTEQIGTQVTVRVVKNKVAPPFKEATFDVIYGKGIDRSRDLLNTGETLGVITRSGSWYAFNDKRLGQGIGNSARALEEDAELASAIEREIREKAGLPGAAEGGQEAKDAD